MERKYTQTKSDKEQLKIIRETFSYAQDNKSFIFIKGGWNIDLAYGEQTRKHGDIDFHFYIKDTDFWINWFKTKEYTVEVVDPWYSIFRRNDIQLDFEAVDIKNDLLIWKHGGDSKKDDVVEKRTLGEIEYMGMNLGVEEYLKNKDPNIRSKDRHDLEILSNLNRT
jgi:hypothetical protein